MSLGCHFCFHDLQPQKSNLSRSELTEVFWMLLGCTGQNFWDLMQVLSEPHGGQIWRQKCPISGSLGWGLLLIPQPVSFHLQSLKTFTFALLNISIDNWATKQVNRCYGGETERRIQHSHLAWKMQQCHGLKLSCIQICSIHLALLIENALH